MFLLSTHRYLKDLNQVCDSIEQDQTARSVQSDLHLHCLQKPVMSCTVKVFKVANNNVTINRQNNELYLT